MELKMEPHEMIVMKIVSIRTVGMEWFKHQTMMESMKIVMTEMIH